MTWTFDFDSHGGYDCLTSGYRVRRDEQLMFVVDTGDHMMESDHPNYESEWEFKHGDHPPVRQLVEQIVEALNKHL